MLPGKIWDWRTSLKFQVGERIIKRKKDKDGTMSISPKVIELSKLKCRRKPKTWFQGLGEILKYWAEIRWWEVQKPEGKIRQQSTFLSCQLLFFFQLFLYISNILYQLFCNLIKYFVVWFLLIEWAEIWRWEVQKPDSKKRQWNFQARNPNIKDEK